MHDHDHSEQEHIPTEEMLSDLAELYKIFGDSTRIKILYALIENEKGVGPSQSSSGGEDGLLRPRR